MTYIGYIGIERTMLGHLGMEILFHEFISTFRLIYVCGALGCHIGFAKLPRLRGTLTAALCEWQADPTYTKGRPG